MDQKLGQESVAVEERGPLWGGGRYGEVFNKTEVLSEWIRSWDRKAWPLKRGGRYGEVFNKTEVLSEWITSWDRKAWPLKRGGRCGEVAVSGGSTVLQTG